MNVLCRFIGPEDENPNYHIVVWMKGWKDERMNEWMNEWTKLMNEWTNWMNKLKEKLMNE